MHVTFPRKAHSIENEPNTLEMCMLPTKTSTPHGRLEALAVVLLQPMLLVQPVHVTDLIEPFAFVVLLPCVEISPDIEPLHFTVTNDEVKVS